MDIKDIPEFSLAEVDFKDGQLLLDAASESFAQLLKNMIRYRSAYGDDAGGKKGTLTIKVDLVVDKKTAALCPWASVKASMPGSPEFYTPMAVVPQPEGYKAIKLGDAQMDLFPPVDTETGEVMSVDLDEEETG